jgi:hypothetical protein
LPARRNLAAGGGVSSIGLSAMRLPVRTLLLCAVLAGPPSARSGPFLDFLLGQRDLEVVTNTVMTPAGRRLPPPAKERPQYYIAVSSGYQDFGGAMGGITQPPVQEVFRLLAAELARRGYLPATEKSPPPTLALFFTWGTLNVDYEPSFDPDLPARPTNRAQILRFIGGGKVGLDDRFLDPLTAPITGLTFLTPDRRELYELSVEDLYVAVVSAYDLDSLRRKQRQLLWTTRIASVSRGFDLPGALPAMVAIGGAHFGRETERPALVRASEQFKPDIRLGEIQLVEYLDGAKLPVVDGTSKR